MKKYIKIIICIAIIVIVISAYFIFKNNYKNTLNNNSVEIITYDRFTTLQNDGGTHYNRKYKVDLNDKKVTKLEDYYKGFEGYKYQDKILYEKNITSKKVKELEKIFDDIIKNKEIYEIDKDKTYQYYTFSNNEYSEIKIYDKDVINKLEELFKK